MGDAIDEENPFKVSFHKKPPLKLGIGKVTALYQNGQNPKKIKGGLECILQGEKLYFAGKRP